MDKKLAAQNIDFPDSELESFKFYDENLLEISLNSWNAKIITLKFTDVIHFTYKLGFQVSNFYEILNDSALVKEALLRNYEKIPIDHPYKLFQLEDIDDFPFIQVVAESVIVSKE